jgi:molybdate transport system substrate-binding protein
MNAGRSWEIPAEMHPPIEQAAVLLTSAKDKKAARAFLDFVKSAAGREVLLKYGFAIPAEGKP